MGANSGARRDAKKRKQAERDRRRQGADGGRAGFGWEPPRKSAGPEPRQERPTDAERAARLLQRAIAAFEDDDEAGCDQALDRLTSGFRPSAAGGRHAGVEAVITRLRAGVGLLFSKGWEPADVLHVCVRELGNEHRRLLLSLVHDVLLRDHRFDGHGRVAGQLVRLGISDSQTRQIFPEAPPLIDPWDPTVAWTVRAVEGFRLAISFLSLVPRLPRLEVLEPRRAASSARPVAGLDEKVLSRVRALLAKAESTTFEEEADAFTAKAQELMARHSIDIAMVDARSAIRDTPGAVRIHIDDPYADAKSILLHYVSAENRCASVFTGALAFSTIFGFDADLDIVELLFTSLLTQATASMLAAGRAVDRSGRSRTRSFRHAFLVAFAQRIGQRLREANAAAAADAAATFGDAMLPVLATRQAEVEEAQLRMFPDLVKRKANVTNTAGWVAGTAAADKANLHLASRLASPANATEG